MNAAVGIWLQGAGEMASGVALRLHAAGYHLVMAEVARPLAVRRLVCFSEAIFTGTVHVAGVEGRRVAAEVAVYETDWVPVMVDPSAKQMERLMPAAVIDARMTKLAPQELPRGEAPLIGLGPGFTAGRDADLVVETHRESTPGRIITTGSALPNTGVPGEVGGRTGERLLRSPAAGRLTARCRIGDLVRKGQIVATVDGRPVVSALDGMLRGLVANETELFAGMKVGDVDPRGTAVDPAQVTGKAQAIGDGVYRALRRLGIEPRRG